jgi:hypothetical protein
MQLVSHLSWQKKTCFFKMAKGRDLLRRGKQWPLKTVAAKKATSLSSPFGFHSLATVDFSILRGCWSAPTLNTIQKEKKTVTMDVK